MSSLFFHSKNDKVTLYGSERAYMGLIINNLMLSVIGDPLSAESWLRPLFPEQHYLKRLDRFSFARSAPTVLRVSYDLKLMLPDIGSIDVWIMALNTAMVAGGDELKLFARLHGQCEVHCWITGFHDKQWLAKIIRSGLRKGIMRKNQNWEKVVAFLLTTGNDTVVCSYSVCESFPNTSCLPKSHPLALRTDDERYYDFNAIPEDERWNLCTQGLIEKGGGLQITQNEWNNYLFGPGISAFDLHDLATKASSHHRERVLKRQFQHPACDPSA